MLRIVETVSQEDWLTGNNKGMMAIDGDDAANTTEQENPLA